MVARAPTPECPTHTAHATFNRGDRAGDAGSELRYMGNRLIVLGVSLDVESVRARLARV
jgi:hypothetical protein